MTALLRQKTGKVAQRYAKHDFERLREASNNAPPALKFEPAKVLEFKRLRGKRSA